MILWDARTERRVSLSLAHIMGVKRITTPSEWSFFLTEELAAMEHTTET
jgi:hypothetical protein